MAKKATRTAKAKAESTAVLQDEVEDRIDAGGDDFDDLSRVGKSKSQSRSKSSKSGSIVSTSESLGKSDEASKAKKAPTTRTGVKRTTASAKSTATLRGTEDTASRSAAKPAETAIPSASAAADTPPSPPATASEIESETEQEEFDPDERAAYLKDEEVVKSQRLRMVEAGAKEAMAVLQNLGSKRLAAARTAGDEGATPRAVPTVEPKLGDAANETEETMTLTAEEQEMTVVEYVRRMYALRQAALRSAGEAKIGEWQEKAKQAREFIESIPARDR